jgi:hypothetical protein
MYALTHEQDRDLAMLALSCRVVEGALGAVFLPLTLGLLSIATAAGTSPPDAAPPDALALLVLAARSRNPIVAATFFAVGSALFSWLLLRGRMIPASLAWLGVSASVLLVVGLPLQLVGALRGPVTHFMWIPMAAFEIPLGFWLLIKGAGEAPPAIGQARPSIARRQPSSTSRTFRLSVRAVNGLSMNADSGPEPSPPLWTMLSLA